MRDRMERFVALPFSIGCVSQSSVAVSENQLKRAQPEPIPAPPSGEGERQLSGKTKSSIGMLLPLPMPNISAGIQRLIKGFKSLPQLFAVYKEDDDDDDEVEMEIGLPTDVQHVAHIGWDGFNNVGCTMKRPEFLHPLPSLSLSQFEMAMAAQGDGGPHGA